MPCACSSRGRTEMRILQSLLLVLLFCLPAAMPALAAEGDADAVATATRLHDHIPAGHYEADPADFTEQTKEDLGDAQLAARPAQLHMGIASSGDRLGPGAAL